MRLAKEYYKRHATELAPDLLGKLLCRKIGDNLLKYRITETECYFGEDDTACHAHKGKTNRTRILYEEGGIAYVYLCYGIHNLLNIVTGEAGFPEAVLIRGAEGFSGPGKLTKQMKIDRSFNGESLILSDKLWVEDDGFKPEFKAARRVGIDYATEKYKNILWRFILTGSK
jgi:DNA-3-methyladenine glycosylase